MFFILYVYIILYIHIIATIKRTHDACAFRSYNNCVSRRTNIALGWCKIHDDRIQSKYPLCWIAMMCTKSLYKHRWWKKVHDEYAHGMWWAKLQTHNHTHTQTWTQLTTVLQNYNIVDRKKKQIDWRTSFIFFLLFFDFS